MGKRIPDRFPNYHIPTPKVCGAAGLDPVRGHLPYWLQRMLQDGSSYEGQFVNGKRHGQGTS